MLFSDEELGAYSGGALKKRRIAQSKPKALREDILSLKQYEGHGYHEKPARLLTDDELRAEAGNAFVYDVESYPNYFEVGFKSLVTGGYVVFEMDDTGRLFFDRRKLGWLAENMVLIGFNNNSYDDIILNAAIKLAEFSPHLAHQITERLIGLGMRKRDIEAEYHFVCNDFNTIDLIEVAVLSASLKLYTGRLACERMQSLPIPPGTWLTEQQMTDVRDYNVNDLDNTELLAWHLKEAIDLRISMGEEYGIDLRSKSDAQIAEHVISSEVKKVNPYFKGRPKYDEDRTFKYKVPPFLDYKTDLMRNVLRVVADCEFGLDAGGHVAAPEEIQELLIPLGHSTYNLVIGGLHSKEKKVSHYTDNSYQLLDIDVTSYYPMIILNLGLYPEQMGPEFLTVFRKIVDRRIAAKKSGDKITDKSLKITINGSFGKFGSMFSSLYAPDLMLAVTMTGQLSLLLLIESLELAGIPVVSGNTDGMVVKCPMGRHDEMWDIVEDWERKTGFTMEETKYRSIHMRDVNNYVAVTMDGKEKRKGFYGLAEESIGPGLAKNPQHEVCQMAVSAFLTDGTPLEDTIRACKDMKRFTVVRNVTGGAEKDGVYIGSPVRWYQSTDTASPVTYCKSGNTVPLSDGAWPLMNMPADMEIPADLDFGWYIGKASEMLRDLGVKA